MSEVRKDVCEQEFKVGDLVAFVRPYTNSITEGKVLKFTPKGVTVESTAPDFLNRVTNRDMNQIIKLPPELRLERLLEN